MAKDVIDNLSHDQALSILRRLANGDPAVRKKIEAETERLQPTVDVEAVCEDVFSELDGIDVHDLWDRSGSTRDGYNDPSELSWEMFDERLEPFLDEVFKLLKMGTVERARLCCMGVLKGLRRYERESQSEFKDWAPDAAADRFSALLERWRKKVGDDKEMEAFVKRECVKWNGVV